jgi:hypothetical protein
MVRALNFPRRYGNLTQCGALPDEHDSRRSMHSGRVCGIDLPRNSRERVSGLFRVWARPKSISLVPRSAARLRAT